MQNDECSRGVLRFNVYLLLLLFLVLISLKTAAIERGEDYKKISQTARRAIGEWKHCYKTLISKNSEQLWEMLERMSNSCREKSLFQRIDTFPLPTQNGDLQFHIYKNGMRSVVRNILVIDNNMDLVTLKHFSNDNVVIVNTTDLYPDCDIRNPDKCEGGAAEPLLLTVHNATRRESGDIESIFTALNITTVDYLLVHEDPYQILSKLNEEKNFESVTVCQIATMINPSGLHNADGYEATFDELWKKITLKDRFAPLEIISSGKKTVLFVNIEHPYCILSYIEPFMKTVE